jgi:pimeloyl-ACP methyl ester carboxylesterase
MGRGAAHVPHPHSPHPLLLLFPGPRTPPSSSSRSPPPVTRLFLLITFAVLIPPLPALLAQSTPTQPRSAERIELQPCRVAGVPVTVRCGTYMVYEDRAHRRGRKIPLFVRVIPSSARTPEPDPFVLVSTGGPGTTNSDVVPFAYARGWSQDRDVVIVDLRGTSGPVSDRLDCDLPGTPEAPLGYLQNVFDTVTVARCRADLEKHADLTQYTTANAMDDLYDALVALGYHRANLFGVSGGTREVLEFIRRHPSMVRSAILAGVAPVSFKNPLAHAQAAQEALDSLFAQCEHDTPCAKAFPKLRAEFAGIRESASRHPIAAPVPPALGGRETTAQLTWPTIAETIRTMSYTVGGGRSIPFVIHQAAIGDYVPLIEAGIQSNVRTKGAIRFGFLLSQTCLEDVPRITDAEVARETANTYLGETRVRQQQAACRQWVHGPAPLGIGDFSPVKSDIPVFMLSGTIDPVTRPRFAADAARYLAHSVLVIAPGAHVPSGPCVDAMERQFLEAPTRPLDTSCVKSMTLPAFRVH